MAARRTPPFRADHVGSLLRPQKLLDARDAHKAGTITAEQLRRVEDESIREAVKLQEEVGLPAITDGEFRRTWWHLDFLVAFANVTEIPPKVSVRFHTDQGDIEYQPPGFKVTGKLARPRPIFVDHFKFVKSVTKETPKITIPSPSMMHFRGGRGAIDQKAYPDMAEFYADLARVYNEEVLDLAAAGCRYLQLDEVNFAYLCDPKLREQVRTNIGEDPSQLTHTYAKLINDVISGKPADMAVTMHLCRGNFQSAWVAEGGYEPVAEVLFNEVGVDGFFLEYDDQRSGGFEPLRFVPKGKTVVLGLVTTKRDALETKDSLKRRIDEAARHIPLDQLALSPQCGFSSTVHGNKVTVRDEIAKLRLVVDTAREVWGLSVDKIAEAAAIIATARLGGTRLDKLPEAIRPADLATGYRVQDAVHALLRNAGHGEVIGHKIGATTPVMQTYLHIDHPCAGGIFAPTVHASGVALPYSGFRRVGLECEVAVRLGRDLGPRDAPHDRAAVARGVDSYMAAVELVDDRYFDWRVMDTPTLAADDFFGAGSVLGAPVTPARAPDLAAATGRAIVNGAEVSRGRGADVMGHPLEALAWLANHFAARGQTLRAGEFVSTGSLVQTLWLAPGDRVAIEVEGLGGVAFTLTRD